MPFYLFILFNAILLINSYCFPGCITEIKMKEKIHLRAYCTTEIRLVLWLWYLLSPAIMPLLFLTITTVE